MINANCKLQITKYKIEKILKNFALCTANFAFCNSAVSGFRFLFASNSGRLPLQTPQIKELAPSHLPPAEDIDPVDPGGMGWKDPLHSYPIGDLSHSERGANSPSFLSNHHPFKELDSFLLPLDDSACR